MRNYIYILLVLLVCNCATTLPVKPDSRPAIIKAEKILKQYKNAPDNVEKSALISIVNELNEQLNAQINYSDAAEKFIKQEQKYRDTNQWKISLVNWVIGVLIVLLLAVVAGIILRISGYRLPFVT